MTFGIAEGAQILHTKTAAFNGPMEISVGNSTVAIRKDIARLITVTDVKPITLPLRTKTGKKKYTPLHKNKNISLNNKGPLHFALVGNQNSGKTSIFNRLVGASRRVGNFAGVTVDDASGRLTFEKSITVTDLPGIRTLYSYTSDEEVTYKFITDKSPDCIINILDATNLSRGLYLTLELLSLNIPLVIGINMIDELINMGGSIDFKKLSYLLATPIVPVCALKNDGLYELVKESVACAERKNIKKVKPTTKSPHSFIEKIVNECIHIPEHNPMQLMSKRIDKLLTGKFISYPVFFSVFSAIFILTFGILGPFLSNALNSFFTVITDKTSVFLLSIGADSVISSLVTDAIMNGVFGVLSFLPLIVVLFFFLSLLEDTGYMSRIAFIMDKPLGKIGLSGKSIVVILLGFGCSVSAIMSSRTLNSKRDKRLTLTLLPFISCSAKLSVFTFLAHILFKERAVFIILALYILSIIMGIIILKITNKSDSLSDFIIELPNYRMPSIKNILLLLFNRAKEFFERAFGIIFISSVIIWLLNTFTFNLEVSKTASDSILASVSNIILPVFSPMGIDDWRMVTSLIVGIFAKEGVVSTLLVLFGDALNIVYAFKDCALPFLVFFLLYPPCIGAIAVLKRELGIKFTIRLCLTQIAVAFLTAILICKLILIFVV